MQNSQKRIQNKVKKTNNDHHKKNKIKLVERFRNQCQLKLKREPPAYIQKYFIKQKERTASINLQILQLDDTLFVLELIKISIIKIHIFYPPSKKQTNIKDHKFHQTAKFKQLLSEIGSIISEYTIIKSLSIQNVPLSKNHLQILGSHISVSKSLKQLSFNNCSLTDDLFQQINRDIAKSQCIAILNLSNNKLKNSGHLIGQILSKHSTRRDEIVWMASLRSQSEQVSEDPGKKGICEVNLENNQMDQLGVKNIIKVLKDDQWMRCLNLKNNKIQKEGIKQFAILMKKNQTLISLDLRQNPGLSRQYSMYIIKKLRQNIERYRQYKQKHTLSVQPSQLIINKSKRKQDKHKSMQQSRRKIHKNKIQTAEYLNNNTLGSVLLKNGNNNTSVMHNSQTHCGKCKSKTIELFNLQKKNLDLQIQLKRVKKILLQKNIDANISAIQSPHQVIQYNSAFQSFHKITGTHPQTDQQLIMKVEQIMMELTKIMENIQAQQNTQMNIQHNDSNVNSLSNTVALFSKPEDLQSVLRIKQDQEGQESSIRSDNIFLSNNQSNTLD